MVLGQGMLWDRDRVALRVPGGWQRRGQGTQQGVGRCGSVLLRAHSCVPGLMSCGCVLARAGNGFEACGEY